MPKISFTGTVFSGAGEGRKFIDLPWVKQQIEEKLGFTPYSGTLNIHLTKKSVTEKKQLKSVKTFEVCPQKNYCTGILVKAYIEGLECGIIIPEVPKYPIDVLEIIAPWYLREHLNLTDGSKVDVTVNV